MKDVDRIRIRKVYASCPGWPSGGSKELSSQTQIYVIPCRLQLPTNKWRSAGPGRSLYLLSLTGLAALGGQYQSLSGTEFSASKRVTFLLPATQAESHAGPKVYIWNVFGRDIGIGALEYWYSSAPMPFSGGTACTCYTCTSPNVYRASLKGIVSWDKIGLIKGFLSTAVGFLPEDW